MSPEDIQWAAAALDRDGETYALSPIHLGDYASRIAARRHLAAATLRAWDGVSDLDDDTLEQVEILARTCEIRAERALGWLRIPEAGADPDATRSHAAEYRRRALAWRTVIDRQTRLPIPANDYTARTVFTRAEGER